MSHYFIYIHRRSKCLQDGQLKGNDSINLQEVKGSRSEEGKRRVSCRMVRLQGEIRDCVRVCSKIIAVHRQRDPVLHNHVRRSHSA